MNRMIYCSRAAQHFDAESLIDLLGSARPRNEKLAVTGMLLYCRRSFLQLLEGEPDALAEVYRRISADPRHTRLRVLTNAAVDDRLFADWSMGFEHVREEDLARHLAGYRPAGRFPLMNPDFIVDGAVALTLLGLYAGHRTR